MVRATVFVALSVLLVLCSEASGQAIGPVGTPIYYKAHNSTVRIDVVFIRDDETVGSEWGHGVLVSPAGTVLTAGHVVFPQKSTFEKYGADTYQLIIKRFDVDYGGFSTFAVINGEELSATSAVTDVALTKLVDCHHFFANTRCLMGKLPLDEDLAFLNTKKRTEFFVGLSGPFDRVDLNIGNMGMRLAVASDFAREGTIRTAKVIPNAGDNSEWPSTYYTDSPFKFNGGVSGSPLYMHTADPKPTLFVSGIVVSRLLPANSLFGEDDSNYFDFRARMIKPDILRVATKHLYDEEVLGYWNCKTQVFPSPSALFSYFLRVQSDTLSEQLILDCGADTKGWSYTSVSIMQSRTDVFTQLTGAINSHLRASCSVSADGETLLCSRQPAESAESLNDIASVLQDLSASSGVRPFDLFVVASLTGADQNLRRAAATVVYFSSDQTETTGPGSAQFDALREAVVSNDPERSGVFAANYEERLKRQRILEFEVDPEADPWLDDQGEIIYRWAGQSPPERLVDPGLEILINQEAMKEIENRL